MQKVKLIEKNLNKKRKIYCPEKGKNLRGKINDRREKKKS